MLILQTTTLFLLLDSLSAWQQYLVNGNFETGDLSDWFCLGGCTITPSSDAYENTGSVMITNRDKKWKGIGQTIDNLNEDTYYELTAYIKLLDLVPGTLYDTVDMMMKCTDRNAGDAYVHTRFGTVPQTRVNIWTKIGGYNYIRAGLHSCLVYVSVEGPSVNYTVDVMSLKEIRKMTDWRVDAEERIEKYRKGNLTVRLITNDPCNYTIEIKQIKHQFAFGSVVGASEMVNTNYTNYQEFFYNNFEWGVFENALKWKSMEWTMDNINYERPKLAMEALQNRGIKIRGHSVFWGVERFVPTWLMGMNPSEIRTELQDRIDGVVNFTKGIVEHWDVNNEVLHGDWFEQALSDPNVTMSMFEHVHAVDSQAKLFINDYGVLESDYAMGIRNQAILYKSSGIPIGAIGLQSHITPANADMTLLKKRLDTVAQTHLPIWITELSVDESNATLKAQTLTDVLTLYFSYAPIRGIILWGFWDRKIWKPDSKLFEGPDIIPNEAGTAFLDLMQTWKTMETITLSAGQETNLRGFKGHYTAKVKLGDTLVKALNFYLGNTKSLDITI